MKNSLFVILLLISLQSCKETPTTEATATKENEVKSDEASSPTFYTDVYNGLGTYESNGKFTYLISLPKETSPNKYTFKLFNIKDKTIFIHLDSDSTSELSNTQNNVYTLVGNLPKYDTTLPYRPNYKVFLWHDNQPVKDALEAERIMNPADSLVAPKKVGMGILSLR